MSDMPDEEQKKLDALEEKLRVVEAVEKKSMIPDLRKGESDNTRAGVQAGMELVVSIVAGTLIGLGLDKWLGTIPLFLLIFFFLGMGTGFYNIYRVTNNLGSAVGFSRLHRDEKKSKTSSESN